MLNAAKPLQPAEFQRVGIPHFVRNDNSLQHGNAKGLQKTCGEGPGIPPWTSVSSAVGGACYSGIGAGFAAMSSVNRASFRS